MINGHTTTRTYRGSSLEELLPQIADELGPDAVITCQRDGIVGGVGGFFGKKCVEIEARPADRPPTIPSRLLLDLYDDEADEAPSGQEEDAVDGEMVSEMHRAEPPAEPEPVTAPAAEEDAPPPPPLFVTQLSAAAERIAVPPSPPAPEPEPEPRAPGMSAAGAIIDGIGVGHSLIWAGLSSEPVASLIGSVLRHSALFSPDKPLADQVKTALSQQIPTAAGWTGDRHVLALVGPAGAGRTSAAAAIARAYSLARISSAVLSLESPRKALRLGALIEPEEVGFDVAASMVEIDFALTRLAGHALIVVDTPAFSTKDPESIDAVARLLDKVGAQAVHLLVPGGTNEDAAGAISASLAGRLDYSHIMISHADHDARVGGAVGLAIGSGRPISYLMSGSDIRVPDAVELAERVLG